MNYKQMWREITLLQKIGYFWGWTWHIIVDWLQAIFI